MRRAALLILILAAGGCASVRAPREPELSVDLPGSWSGTTAALREVPGRWWAEFNEAGLTSMVEEALLRNPDLAQAEARLRGALALAKIAGADLLPQLSAGQRIGRENRFVGESEFAAATQRADSFGVSLNLSWELDLWARVRSGEAAAIADARAQLALLEGARLSLAAQTAKAWFLVTEAGLQLSLAGESLASARSLEGRIRERYEGGLRRALDVKLAESEVAAARAAQAAWERVRDTALRQLESLAGRYPGATAATAAGLPSLPGPVQAGIPADVLSRRPDLAVAEMSLAAASHRVQEAEASLYPKIALTGSGGVASSALSGFVRGDYGVWSIAGSLAAPLFTGGKLRANVDASKAREEEALAAFAGGALTAFREVETALSGERILAAREDALRSLATSARDGLELSEERYLSGLADILTVLEARSRHFSAQGQLIDVQRERLDLRVDLYAALGGGDRPSKGTSW